MAWREWIDIESVQAVVRHMISNLCAVTSFWSVSKVISILFGATPFAVVLDYTEDIVLFGLMVIFAVQIGYDMYVVLQETRRHVLGKIVILA